MSIALGPLFKHVEALATSRYVQTLSFPCFLAKTVTWSQGQGNNFSLLVLNYLTDGPVWPLV